MCFGKERPSNSQPRTYENDLEWAVTTPTAYLLVYQRISDNKAVVPSIPELLKNEITYYNLANTNIKIVFYLIIIVL